MRSFARAYGAGPLHLLGLLATFLIFGYAALKIFDDPVWYRYLFWFVGAALAHDLVLAPLYGLLDRSAQPLFRRGARTAPSDPGDINYLRVPAFLSGLLLLVFFSSITRGGEQAFEAASGRTQQVFLGRWLLISGVLFLVSALVYAVRGRRRQPSSSPDGPVPHVIEP